MSLKSAAALAVVALLAAGSAHAEIVHFTATLNGAGEVPPNTTAGTGEVTAELETTEKTLAWRASYSGLTGPATAAHFHGPAAPGTNAPPQVMITDPAHIGGSALLNDKQVDDLLAGKWYFNIHTAANPGGEVRGQLQRIN